jgi:predicted O-methyltransferase YrrM
MSPFLLFWSKFDWRRAADAPIRTAWLEERFRTWLAYTLPSVLAQSCEDFAYWLICDPANRALTQSLRACLRDERVRIVYLDECAAQLRALPARDRYMVIRIDSDDLYAPDVASLVLRRTERVEFLQFNRGYACDLRTGVTRDWVSRSSPFAVHIYGRELRDRGRWSEPNHTTIRGRSVAELDPGQFLVTLHGLNSSSSISASKRNGTLGSARAREVLRSFGLGSDRRLDALETCARGTRGWQQRAEALHRSLRPLHARYVREVSSEVMASSLETAALLQYLCELLGARRILDLGSGFSSFATRAYAAAHPGVVCHSVDTSPVWLTKTRAWLDATGVPDEGLFTWDEYRERREAGYDLVLHDLGTMPVRLETLPRALGAVLPTGLLVLDDLHKAGFASHVGRHLGRFAADRYPEATVLTRDRLGRYAGLFGRVIGPLS